jgi:hypothetical protein
MPRKDGNMDTTRLTARYPDGLPSEIEEGVKTMESLRSKAGIISVKLFGNFGKDLEQSLHHSKDVYKGLIVQCVPNYKLTADDICWFHPQLAKTRSLYSGTKQFGDMKLPEFNCLVGEYSTYSVDELGTQAVENFTIVDTHLPRDHEWVDKPIKEIYSGYKDDSCQEKTVAYQDNQVTPNKAILRTEYVSLFKGANVYHCYNHVIKSSGDALVLQSPLMGYSRVSDKGDLESDTMLGFMDVNALSQQNRNRIYRDCLWDSSNVVNTLVMKRGEISKGEAYRMLRCKLSDNNISGKLDTATTLKLTPKKSNIPTGCKKGCSDILDIDPSDDIVITLMKANWKEMISSKYYNGGKLQIPRDMAEKYLI